jgi:hypothetical protein
LRYVIVCENGASLAGVEILARLKTETSRLAVGSDFASAPLGQVRLARVFDDRHPATSAGVEDGVEIGGRAAQVDGQDHLCVAGDGTLDFVRVDLEGVDIGIDENRQRTHQQNGVDRGDERIGGNDDLVARPYAERAERRDQRAGAIGGGEAVPGAGQRRIR